MEKKHQKTKSEKTELMVCNIQLKQEVNSTFETLEMEKLK